MFLKSLKVLSLGHGNEGVEMSPNLFIGSDKIEILDLGAAKSNLDENLLVPLTGLKYLFVQFNIIPKISTRNELGNLFDNQK